MKQVLIAALLLLPAVMCPGQTNSASGTLTQNGKTVRLKSAATGRSRRPPGLTPRGLLVDLYNKVQLPIDKCAVSMQN
jgi:hypothetical protein